MIEQAEILQGLHTLLERTQDTALQRRATLLYRALLKGLSEARGVVLKSSRQTGQLVFRISGAKMFRRVPGVPEARFLAIDVPIYQGRTSLTALTRPEGAVRYVLTWKPSVIRLPPNVTYLDKVSLQELREILHEAAKRDRTKLLHELTHFVDVVRLGGERWQAASRGYKSDIEDPERYANDPLELNAYFQQLASAEREDFEAALNGSDPTWDLWQWLDLDVKKAVREFTRKVTREIWQNMTERNKRRFRKRAALFYDEMKRQAHDKIAELAAQGNEDALYVLHGEPE